MKSVMDPLELSLSSKPFKRVRIMSWTPCFILVFTYSFTYATELWSNQTCVKRSLAWLSLTFITDDVKIYWEQNRSASMLIRKKASKKKEKYPVKVDLLTLLIPNGKKLPTIVGHTSYVLVRWCGTCFQNWVSLIQQS